jgi:hypothetical protein
MTPFQIVAQLQNLYFNEKKPAELRPVDLALLTYLILRQTEDHFITDSQLTLAQRLGCERRTIADSISRLSEIGWIVSRAPYQWSRTTKRKTRRIGGTIGLSINLDKLPKARDRAKHAVPSQDAIDIAARYTTFLRKSGVNTKHKNFGKHQEHAAQRLIENLGDPKRTVDLINFALQDERFRKTACKSLYEIRTRLAEIRLAYQAQTVRATV